MPIQLTSGANPVRISPTPVRPGITVAPAHPGLIPSQSPIPNPRTIGGGGGSFGGPGPIRMPIDLPPEFRPRHPIGGPRRPVPRRPVPKPKPKPKGKPKPKPAPQPAPQPAPAPQPVPTPAPVPQPPPAPPQLPANVGAEAVRANNTGGFDPNFAQNMAVFGGGDFTRPNGMLAFNPFSRDPWSGIGKPIGGGRGPVFGPPRSLLEQANINHPAPPNPGGNPMVPGGSPMPAPAPSGAGAPGFTIGAPVSGVPQNPSAPTVSASGSPLQVPMVNPVNAVSGQVQPRIIQKGSPFAINML